MCYVRNAFTFLLLNTHNDTITQIQVSRRGDSLLEPQYQGATMWLSITLCSEFFKIPKPWKRAYFQ